MNISGTKTRKSSQICLKGKKRNRSKSEDRMFYQVLFISIKNSHLTLSQNHLQTITLQSSASKLCVFKLRRKYCFVKSCLFFRSTTPTSEKEVRKNRLWWFANINPHSSLSRTHIIVGLRLHSWVPADVVHSLRVKWEGLVYRRRAFWPRAALRHIATVVFSNYNVIKLHITKTSRDETRF